MSGLQKVAALIYICKKIQTSSVYNNSIASKVYDCYFLVWSAHEKKKGYWFTVVKYESNAVDIFILLLGMVNRCKNPEINAVARSRLRVVPHFSSGIVERAKREGA